MMKEVNIIVPSHPEINMLALPLPCIMQCVLTEGSVYMHFDSKTIRWLFKSKLAFKIQPLRKRGAMSSVNERDTTPDDAHSPCHFYPQ